MKKALILALVLMGAAVSVHAAPRYRAAVGGIFGIDVMGSLPSSAMVSFRLPKFPPVFALGMTLNESNPAFALMADWWLYQTNLFSFITWHDHSQQRWQRGFLSNGRLVDLAGTAVQFYQLLCRARSVYGL